jgi:hypothetical protein
VQEAYVNGVSTRKVDRLVEQMGLRGLSTDQVSRMCRGLMIRSRRSATGRWTALIRTCGWTRRSRRSANLANARPIGFYPVIGWPNAAACERWDLFGEPF